MKTFLLRLSAVLFVALMFALMILGVWFPWALDVFDYIYLAMVCAIGLGAVVLILSLAYHLIKRAIKSFVHWLFVEPFERR